MTRIYSTDMYTRLVYTKRTNQHACKSRMSKTRRSSLPIPSLSCKQQPGIFLGRIRTRCARRHAVNGINPRKVDVDHQGPPDSPISPRPRRQGPLCSIPRPQIDTQQSSAVADKPLDAVQRWQKPPSDAAAGVVRVDLVVGELFERRDEGGDVAGRCAGERLATGVMAVVTAAVAVAIGVWVEVGIDQGGSEENGPGAEGKEAGHLAEVEGVAGAGVAQAAAALVVAGWDGGDGGRVRCGRRFCGVDGV